MAPGMRKGTRSCLECRKRKIKCIYTNSSDICITCTTKGRNCTEQSKTTIESSPVALSKSTLEERVAQLEELIKSQASGGAHHTVQNVDRSPGPLDSLADRERSQRESRESRDGSSGLPTPESNIVHHEVPVSRRRDINPVGSLFDNAIWKQKKSDQEQDLTAQAHGGDLSVQGVLGGASLTKSSRVCDQLCQNLLPLRLIASIIRATDSWWNTWRTKGGWLWQEMEQKKLSTLQDVVNWTLASSEPPIASIGILCIAVSLQQLDTATHSSIISQLPKSPGELFHDYFDRVNRLIINDNGYSTSLPGIEVIKMSYQIFMNLGTLKMTWILNHRAISHAQLLGLHRSYRSSSGESETQMTVRQETWFTLCEHDVYTSLLLGLPYATDGHLISPTVHGPRGTLKFFRYRLIRLSSRIIDRNQMGNELSILETSDIETEMDSAANELPAELWDAPTALREAIITRTEYYERLAARFWFFQIKVLLHQPLMLESIENQQLLPNRNACLDACRNTMKIYKIMRSDSISAFSLVKVIDYQAFLCSALLLLALLGYGSHNPESSDQEGDWETVQSTLNILRQASMASNNSFTSQALQGLETLASLVGTRGSGGCIPSEQHDTQHCVARISIPGTGVITITPGKLLQKPIVASHSSSNFAPPVFHLSHGSPQSLPSQNNSQLGTQTGTGLHDGFESPGISYDISKMDFDMTNMLDVDMEADWAWLIEANSGIL